MSDVPRERVACYADRHPDATTAQVLGRFRLDPTDDETRELVADVLGKPTDADESGQRTLVADGGSEFCATLGCENPPLAGEGYCEECASASPGILDDAAGESVNPAGEHRPDSPENHAGITSTENSNASETPDGDGAGHRASGGDGAATRDKDSDPATWDAPPTESGRYPTDLLDGERWHAWKETPDGRKVPRAPWLTGGDAFVSAQDPDAWLDHADAAEWIDTLPGYGMALNIRDREEYPDETLVLIDFDDARDPETGEIHPRVRRFIQRTGSYADVSTSGTGIHILVRGSLPDGVKAIDGALSATDEFPDAEIEVYDSGRFVAMTGRHIRGSPAETTAAQGLIDDLADEFATVAEGTPDELVRDPEKSRAELADVETTDEIQDVFDAIQHTGPRDVRLRSPVTHERADGSKSLDPTWSNSESGTRLAQVGDGWVYRKGMRGLDALQVVALEERIVASESEYPTGGEFWRAVEALRERGAHIPEFDGGSGGGEPVAVLPELSPRARAAANGWDWRSADAESADDAPTVDDARESTRAAIADAYRTGDRALVEALPTMGKSFGAIAAAADTGEPITVLTGRGNKEQYEQYEEWCDKHGLRAEVLPSVYRDCGTFAGEHGRDVAETVREWYDRGATGKDVHIHYQDETGEPIPCDGPEGARCDYKTEWKKIGRDTEDYDVLIGHYNHAHVQSVTQGRTVVFDEFPGDAFETTLDGRLAGAITRFLKAHRNADALPESYGDLMNARADDARRADALAWFADHDPEPDGSLAFDPSGEGHAIAPLAAFTLLAGAESDLGNGWERVELPDGDGVGVFDHEEGRVRLLRPPTIGYANGVVALDGTPTRRLWDLALGEHLTHTPVLDGRERVEYVRDSLGVNVVRTTDAVKPYSGNEEFVGDRQDAALLDGIAAEHGSAPALLTTLTGERSHENAGLYETDGDGGLVDGNGRVSDLAHYGDLKGSNRLASTRLGAVIGSRNYGDGFVKKWGAFAGERVGSPDRSDPENRGVGLSYGGVGDDVLRHMREHETMQAVMRFGRDGGGATVYVHTNTLPDWFPVVGEGRVVRTRSDGEREVLDAIDDLGASEWSTADVAEHPGVAIGTRQVREHLHRLADDGYLSVSVEGSGFTWCDDGLHRVGENGEVELEAVEPGELADEESAELARSSIYTWEFRTPPGQPGGERPGDGAGGARDTRAVTDGGEPPPDDHS